MPKFKTTSVRRVLSFLVTAGPTIEDIDPVRFISNRSTGVLGANIAAAAARAGHRVVLVHGPLSDKALRLIPPGVRTVPVRSARQMHAAVLRHALAADVAVLNAAVADYTPAAVSPVKLKKSGGATLLRLRPTVDIALELGRAKARGGGPLLVGFALETGSGRTPAQRGASRLAEARRKLRDKNLDAIILNEAAAMGAERADFTVIQPAGAILCCRAAGKRRFAAIVVRLAERLAARKGEA